MALAPGQRLQQRRQLVGGRDPHLHQVAAAAHHGAQRQGLIGIGSGGLQPVLAAAAADFSRSPRRRRASDLAPDSTSPSRQVLIARPPAPPGARLPAAGRPGGRSGARWRPACRRRRRTWPGGGSAWRSRPGMLDLRRTGHLPGRVHHAHGVRLGGPVDPGEEQRFRQRKRHGNSSRWQRRHGGGEAGSRVATLLALCGASHCCRSAAPGEPGGHVSAFNGRPNQAVTPAPAESQQQAPYRYLREDGALVTAKGHPPGSGDGTSWRSMDRQEWLAERQAAVVAVYQRPTGKYFRWPAAAGHRVVGADQSAGMLAQARAKAIASRLEHIALQDLPYVLWRVQRGLQSRSTRWSTSRPSSGRCCGAGQAAPGRPPGRRHVPDHHRRGLQVGRRLGLSPLPVALR